MNFQLRPKATNGAKEKKLMNWLGKNNRVRIDCCKNGVVVTNVCCMNLRTRRNGQIKRIFKGKSTGLLVVGQDVLIEGKIFSVQIPA